MDLRYERINKDNIITAAKVQYEIFPNSSAYSKYLQEIKDDKNGLPVSFLVFEGELPIGVVGLYEIPEYSDTIWISWFGLLKNYRLKGYGSQILRDIIEKARRYNKDFLRLFTYEKWNSEAQEFYKKHMQIGEYYTNKDDDQFNIKEGKCKIFGLSLSGKKIDFWNDKFIDIASEDIEHEKSIKLMKKAGIL